MATPRAARHHDLEQRLRDMEDLVRRLSRGSMGERARTITSTGAIPASLIDAKGDVIAGTADNTPARVAVGADGQVLTADSAQTAGVKWATPATPAAGPPSWTSKINDSLATMAGFRTALSGTWSIVSGVLNQSSTAASAARMSYNTSLAPCSIRAVEVECGYVNGAGTARRMGMIVSSADTGSANLLVYAESAAGSSWIIRIEQDGVAIFSSTSTISYTGTGYLRLSVIQTGAGLDIYLNGVWLTVINVGAFTAGPWVGLYTYQCAANFRNLKAWNMLTSPF